jgi:hypothetical protein
VIFVKSAPWLAAENWWFSIKRCQPVPFCLKPVFQIIPAVSYSALLKFRRNWSR